MDGNHIVKLYETFMFAIEKAMKKKTFFAVFRFCCIFIHQLCGKHERFSTMPCNLTLFLENTCECIVIAELWEFLCRWSENNRNDLSLFREIP